VGMVTQTDLLRAGPSHVTTLNVYEIASLLDDITMDRVMTCPVLAVEETCSITNAANFMLNQKIDSLLVVRDEKLVGIITAKDIFRTFVEITGGSQPGTRIEVKLPNQKGHLAPFMQALSNAGSYIVSLAIDNKEDIDYGYMDVKERGGDEVLIRSEIDRLGYVEILSFRSTDADELLTFGKPKAAGRAD